MRQRVREDLLRGLALRAGRGDGLGRRRGRGTLDVEPTATLEHLLPGDGSKMPSLPMEQPTAALDLHGGSQAEVCCSAR
jgi:hypothetical protein